MWFRRDLRLSDLPALRAAVDSGADGVVPLFVLDPALWDPAGSSRMPCERSACSTRASR